MSLTTPLEKAMDESYHRGYKDSRSLLKYPHEIISFVDSCGFTSEQLQRIIRDIEELKGSDFDEGFDKYFTKHDMTDELREQNGEFDKA